MKRRSLGVLLVCLGLVGLIGTAWAYTARPSPQQPPAPWSWAPLTGIGRATACDVPTLPGQTIDVVLTDMGRMMGGGMMGDGRMMSVTTNVSSVPAGEVSFRVWNAGMMVHELVVLPLLPGGAGTRPIGRDSQVSETGSIGEASNSCGEGTGEGIAPGAVSWVTLQLAPGHYELICNLPGHYAAGMFIELDVQ